MISIKRLSKPSDGIPVHHVLPATTTYQRPRRPASNVPPPPDPLYGKSAFEQRFNTKTYRSFDHSGYHFILLDAIQITPTREFDAAIDPAQLTPGLAADLAATPAGTPIIVACHVPLVSSVVQYAPPGDKIGSAKGLLLGNTSAVLPLFEGHNIITALPQGHTHINETVYWRDIPFITSGAVSGNWWHGSPLGYTRGLHCSRARPRRRSLELPTLRLDLHRPRARPLQANPCTLARNPLRRTPPGPLFNHRKRKAARHNGRGRRLLPLHRVLTS